MENRKTICPWHRPMQGHKNQKFWFTNICFCIEIRKKQKKKNKKKNNNLEMCPQNTDAPAVGYLIITLQNSTCYKCLNLSLTGSRTYVCMYGKPTNEMPPATDICCGGIKKKNSLTYTKKNSVQSSAFNYRNIRTSRSDAKLF